ncbi:Trk K+ transport system, NAD-binding component [Cyclonatronum proteinivorum]|uniref:Trk K+ transport system, NAD-binding component n=2 Tax=Cyclonatronum proteinivorum TaxID=1457365 RepID=A0A345UIR4_9BACT|nr:Trk K+ transport system, NAD-binding component [Cyclonatronum proteinivorum]
MQEKEAKSNLSGLMKFLLFLAAIIALFSILFHLLMVYEGQDHSWVSGFYWTLTVMSTLGFGDITFQSDLGRIFSMVVLLSGVILLLVLLPFTFIRFFYAPWLEAYNKVKTPTELHPSIKGHVIITNFDSVARSLIEKLNHFGHSYYILVGEHQRALDLYNEGYKVLVGSLDDPETYRKIQIQNAAMVVATCNDMLNTNIAFTVREISEKVRIITFASFEDSVDIHKLAGSNTVVQLARILGQSLARRTLGGSARVHVIGRMDQLIIGEAPVIDTPLVGKTLAESKLRQMTGVSVIGVWERGKFESALPETVIRKHTVLVLAGKVDQLRNYDEYFGIYHSEDKPVIIIGGGRVGLSTAKSLEDRMMDYVIVERDPARVKDPAKFVKGDAADLATLKKAGIDTAHTVIITTNLDEMNIYLTLYCRRLRPDIQITARATDDRNVSSMHRAGADFVMSYATMGANIIYNALDSSEIITLAEGLNIFRLGVPDKLVGVTLLESDIRQETGCSVIAINCEGEMNVNPNPENKIPAGCELVVIGTKENEAKFMEYVKA